MSAVPLSEGDVHQFFRLLHGRRMAALSDIYPLPVDADEEKRQEFHHRLMQFIFSGKNWVGPVKAALQFGEKRRILDLGTGKGYWAVEMADEFPRADVIGIDIAPIQPEYVPPNCQFEICNLNEPLPYADESFDLIHSRSVHIGIQDYPALVEEIGRLLKPGGLVLLIEPDAFPAAADESRTAGPEKATVHLGQPGVGGPEHPHDVPTARDLSSNSAAESSHTNHAYADGDPVVQREVTETANSEGSLRPGGVAVRQEQTTAGMAQRLLPSGSRTPGLQADNLNPIRARSRAPTTNRRHIDFILNHEPTSPGPTVSLPPPTADRRNDSNGVSPNTSCREALTILSSEDADISVPPPPTMPGWSKLWSLFRSCLENPPRNVEIAVPSQLGDILLSAGSFENIVVKQANVPVGFWPQDSTMLTIGQLQWMDYELLIPALQPLFLSSGILSEEVSRIIQDAQHDLYYPTVPLLAHIHIAHGTKRR